MVHTLTTFAAETAWQADASKAMMVAFALGFAAISLGLIGSNYMKALGRNPEAGKNAGQLIIVAAMVELTALLGFAAVFVL